MILVSKKDKILVYDSTDFSLKMNIPIQYNIKGE